MRPRPWVAGLRLPLLRGRARPLAKLDAADKTGSVVGHRQRKTPVTAPRRGGSQGPVPHPARLPRMHGARARAWGGVCNPCVRTNLLPMFPTAHCGQRKRNQVGSHY